MCSTCYNQICDSKPSRATAQGHLAPNHSRALHHDASQQLILASAALTLTTAALQRWHEKQPAIAVESVTSHWSSRKHLRGRLFTASTEATLAGSRLCCTLPSPCEGFLDALRPGPSCRSALRATHGRPRGSEQPGGLAHSQHSYMCDVLFCLHIK